MQSVLNAGKNEMPENHVLIPVGLLEPPNFHDIQFRKNGQYKGISSLLLFLLSVFIFATI